MNFIFVSPNFPPNYWQFCDRLGRNGANVLGIGDAPYESLEEPLRYALTEYYRVDTLEDYGQMVRAVGYFTYRYGKIDWLESNNEYWLEQDARLRTDFHITTGIHAEQIGIWKRKSAMKPVYRSAGIPTARCHSVGTAEATRAFLEKIGGFPVIAKPDVGVGAAGTYKIEDDAGLAAFFAAKPDIPYVMEEFVEGDICSYDAIADSRCEPLFESMSVWPSIADIVNRDLDLFGYTCPAVPEALRRPGRAALKAFGVRSRFAHLEFFRLAKAHPGLGGAGDFVALEVNMRPVGGNALDMMNFAHATDVYQIWADMVTDDCLKRKLPDGGDHWCACASRKDWHRYVHTHEEILARYGGRIALCERMPELMWPAMGCQMYMTHADSEDEAREFIAFVHKREAQ